MKLLLSYLWLNRKGVCLFALFCGIFASFFLICRLPWEAVYYPVLLSGSFGAVFLFLDFFSFRRCHRELTLLLNEITVTVDALPPPKTLLDEDWEALIRAIHEDKATLSTEWERRYRDMTDYYTLWVHQIKTPIAAMRLLLSTRESSPEQTALLWELMRIEQYVEMVLSYIRLDSETSDYVIQSCDLDGIVKQAVRKYASQIIARQLKIRYEPLRTVVLADEKWLLFVVEQILSNAVKYTRAGEIKISLSAPKVLCIRDTGIGIDPSDLPRVFEKGFTGYNGREDKRATGIGLYLCRRILEKMNQSIRIESEVGKGTSVFLDLREGAVELE